MIPRQPMVAVLDTHDKPWTPNPAVVPSPTTNPLQMQWYFRGCGDLRSGFTCNDYCYDAAMETQLPLCFAFSISCSIVGKYPNPQS